MAKTTVDITPTPRILRTLGDIPFAAWQCLAELADNGIDAIAAAAERGIGVVNPRIDIHWSSEDAPAAQREVVVRDNGPGMSLDILQNAARAGYSANDPINSLGLFGMGFNIATARLGDETEFLSATEDSEEWVGIRIVFDELIKSKKFSAPVIHRQKSASDVSGTMIVTRQLKAGVFSELKTKERSIRQRLENIYTPILLKKNVEIFLQSKQLAPHPRCAWSESRYVIRKGVKIAAVQTLDRDLGETFFDVLRNRYVSYAEATEFEATLAEDGAVPKHIVRRSRRLRGWIGVQRYSDPSDFGIDFVRNGRKILVNDKALFGYENPETGTMIHEYPVELGSTVGGRLVGEVHVDYLIPTYQKNAFDTTDQAWRLTVDVLRGAGPILPKKRQAFGYADENNSPIGKLVNAYRRTNPGTKCLALANSVAKEFYNEFRRGNPEYETDEKWFKTAQETDRERNEGGEHDLVDSGALASDDVDEFGPTGEDDGTSGNGSETGDDASLPMTSARDALITNSEKVASLCGKYAYGTKPGFDVTSWKVHGEQIRVNGDRVPCHLFQDGIDMDFFYDPTHLVLAEFPITPKQLLLQVLAEKFALRDTGVSIQGTFIGLVENHLGEERINLSVLQERAMATFGDIRDRLPGQLGHKFKKVVAVIRQVESEEEELAKRLLEEVPQLLEEYQSGSAEAVQALAYVTNDTILRLVSKFPEEFLDGNLFSLPYQGISIGDASTQERLRELSLQKTVAYLKDSLLLMRSGVRCTKDELLRHANTLAILEGLLV